jgi:nicotinamidase/pyrazinamidase
VAASSFRSSVYNGKIQAYGRAGGYAGSENDFLVPFNEGLMMSPKKPEKNDALLIVDLQLDFCPGGALAVGGGDEVIPVINDWIHAAQKEETTIVASRDWHPPQHVSFQERGGPWPPHCIQQTRGARFHPDLELPSSARIISKGTDVDEDQYSAFDRTGLADELSKKGIERVWVGGLAQDVCVLQTVLDGVAAGFEMHLIKDATRPVNVNPGDGRKALREMEDAGAILEVGVPV